MVIVSNVAVDLLMDSLPPTIRDVLTNIDVGVLVNVNIDVFVGLTDAFEFAILGSLEYFRC